MGTRLSRLELLSSACLAMNWFDRTGNTLTIPYSKPFLSLGATSVGDVSRPSNSLHRSERQR